MTNFTSFVGLTIFSIFMSQRSLSFLETKWAQNFEDISDLSNGVWSSTCLSYNFFFIYQKKCVHFTWFLKVMHQIHHLHSYCQRSLLSFDKFFWWDEERPTYASSIFAWHESSSHIPLVNFLKPKMISILIS